MTRVVSYHTSTKKANSFKTGIFDNNNNNNKNACGERLSAPAVLAVGALQKLLLYYT